MQEKFRKERLAIRPLIDLLRPVPTRTSSSPSAPRMEGVVNRQTEIINWQHIATSNPNQHPTDPRRSRHYRRDLQLIIVSNQHDHMFTRLPAGRGQPLISRQLSPEPKSVPSSAHAKDDDMTTTASSSSSGAKRHSLCNIPLHTFIAAGSLF